MDEIDKALVKALQKNARTSLKDISKQINLSLPSTSERLRKLESLGYINGYTALLDNYKMGKLLTCFCMVILKEQPFSSEERFRELVQEKPEIIECHCVAGEHEYIMKVVTESTRSLEKLLNSFRQDFGVIKSYTYTVLVTVKEKPGIYL